MSKLNIRKMSEVGFESLSQWNVANMALVRLNAAHKNAVKAQNALIKKATDEKNHKALLEATAHLHKMEEDHKAECKPYRDAMKAVSDNVSDYLYPAYALYMLSMGNNDMAMGKYEVKDKKGEVKYAYDIDSSNNYRMCVSGFLGFLGINTSDAHALTVAIDTISKRIGGMQKDSKGGLIKLKSESSMKDMLIRATIAYMVDRGAFTIAEDGSLIR